MADVAEKQRDRHIFHLPTIIFRLAVAKEPPVSQYCSQEDHRAEQHAIRILTCLHYYKLFEFALTHLILLGTSQSGSSQNLDCYTSVNIVNAFYGEELFRNPSTNRYEWYGYFDVDSSCINQGTHNCCTAARFTVESWNVVRNKWDFVDEIYPGIDVVECGEDNVLAAVRVSVIGMGFFQEVRVSLAVSDGCPPGEITWGPTHSETFTTGGPGGGSGGP